MSDEEYDPREEQEHEATMAARFLVEYEPLGEVLRRVLAAHDEHLGLAARHEGVRPHPEDGEPW